MKRFLYLITAVVLLFFALSFGGCTVPEEKESENVLLGISAANAGRVTTFNTITGEKRSGEFVQNASVPGNSVFTGDAYKIEVKERDYLLAKLNYTADQLTEMKSSYGKVVFKIYVETTVDKQFVRNRDGAKSDGDVPTTPNLFSLVGCTGGPTAQRIPLKMWKEYRVSLSDFITVMKTGDGADDTVLITWLDLPDPPADESAWFYIGEISLVAKSTV